MRYLLPFLLAVAVLAASASVVAQQSQPAPDSQPTLVGAPTLSNVPAADPGVKGAWGTMKKAFQTKQYRGGIAALLTILIFLWRRFLFGFVMHRLSPAKVGVVTVVLAFVGTLPTALTADPFSWSNFIWDGLVASGEAMLLWQLILKRLPWFKVPEGGKAPQPVPVDGSADTVPSPLRKPGV